MALDPQAKKYRFQSSLSSHTGGCPLLRREDRRGGGVSQLGTADGSSAGVISSSGGCTESVESTHDRGAGGISADVRDERSGSFAV